MSQQLEQVTKRLEEVTARLETISNLKPALPPKPQNGSNSNLRQGVPPSIKQYDELIRSHLDVFTSISRNIGDDVVAAASHVKTAFDELGNYIWYAAGRETPSQADISEQQRPIGQVMEKIVELKESKRNTKFFNHLSAIAEGIPSVGWINISPAPAPYIKEMTDASMFFVNRVRNENKANQLHADWAKSWCDLLNALHKYVKDVHTTGLIWNSAPGVVSPATDSEPTRPSVRPGQTGPPPPPPPPPAGLFSDIPKVSTGLPDETGTRQALFAELNKGESITANLKKVTADMQTHKNPQLRGQAIAPLKSQGTDVHTSKTIQEKTPKIEFQDHKTWNVEYHKNNRDIVINITDLKQTVYIFRCEGSVIQIKGKVNSVTVDNCRKTSVVFDNLLGQVEVINCQSIEVQTLGTLPTISIQKTDGCQVYLSKDAMNSEIVTSKSSSMNVLVPKGDDFIELPVPEQFKTIFNATTNKLDTTVSDIV